MKEIIKKTTYTTSDNQMFTDEDLAINHQTELNYKRDITSFLESIFVFSNMRNGNVVKEEMHLLLYTFKTELIQFLEERVDSDGRLI